MGGDGAGVDRLIETGAAPESHSAPWDRFAHWRRWPARILILAFAALALLAAIVPLSNDEFAHFMTLTVTLRPV